MKIKIEKLEIEIEGKADELTGKYFLQILSNAKAEVLPAAAKEPEPEEAPKKAKAKKEEPKEEAADDFEETTPADGVPFEEDPDKAKYTKEDVRGLMAQLIKKDGKGAAKELLSKFGAKDLSSLPLGKYDAVYAAVKEALDA